MTQILFNKAFEKNKPLIPDEYIDSAIIEDKLNKLILVLPTGKLVRRYNQAIIRKYFDIHKKPLEYLRIFTLQQFIEFCYDKIIPNRKRFQVSEPYRLTIFEESVENADLKFYKRKERKISAVLLERLANVIFGLKDDGITIAKLEEDIKSGENSETTFFDANRISDIIELYRNYDLCLGDKFLDFPKILSLVITNIDNNQNGDLIQKVILPDIENLVFLGFSEFRKPEIDFIGKFSATSLKTTIYIDYTINNGPIFGNLDDSIISLQDKGFLIINNDFELENREKQDFIYNNFDSKNSQFTRELYIRRWLFNTTSDMKSTGFSKMLKIIACENMFYEAQHITKLVKYLILRENLKPTEICICMRQPQMYSGLFRELFSSYKVPVNISDRFDLSASPLVITIFSILNVINKGYRIEDVHKMVGSKYIVFDDNIDTANIIEQAKKFRILGGNSRGGAKYWKHTFSQRLISIKKRIVNLQNQNISESQELYRAVNDEKNLQKAIDNFDFLSSLFIINKNKISPLEFSNFINVQIIEKLNFKENIVSEYKKYYSQKDKFDNIEKNTYEEAIEKDARAMEAFIELVKELCYILGDRFPKMEYNLDELIEKLKTAVTTAKYQISEKEEFGVNITSIEQTRGIPYKVMILCGAIDGVYPLQYKTDTFLGKELKSSMKKHLNSERLQFYQFLTNDKDSFNKAEKLIFMTYPTHHDDEELVRSSFIDALLKITNIAEENKIYQLTQIKNSKDSEDFKNIIKEIPWLNTTANNRELYELMGHSIINNYNTGTHTTKNSEVSNYINFIIKNSVEKNEIQVHLLPDNLQDKIASYKDRPISCSDLELYASCPYKFFVRKILGLDIPEDLDLSMSSLVKGNILHSILYNFFTQIKNEQLDKDNYPYLITANNSDISPIIPVILDPNEKNYYILKLKQLAAFELDYIKFEHPFYKLEEERIIGSNKRISILENWLNHELFRIKNGWGFSPVLFEFGFGIGKHSKVDYVEVDGLKIRGKIDRIEFMKLGESFKFIIADYKNKTNRKHNLNFIKEGTAFQMPLYILAAKEFLSKEYNIEAECDGAVYYSFEAEKISKSYIYHKFNLLEQDSYFTKLFDLSKSKIQTLQEGEGFHDVLINSLHHAKKIVESISSGIFPVEPKHDECKRCGFISICRYSKRNILDIVGEEEQMSDI